jgi:acylphosphatase
MHETSPRAWRWLVTGRVQGVGFRHFTVTQARQLGVLGWVKNLPDGRVEIRVTGEPEAVAAFKRRVEEGPRWGRVDHLEEEPREPDAAWEGFGVRY